MDFRKQIQAYAHLPLHRHLMLDLLKEYSRPNDKISELIKAGDLIAVKRGLYVAAPDLSGLQPEPFLIANHLRGPSYVSLESAMGYWGLIPERVYEISSVTVKTSKTYNTPLGRFSFQQLPLPYYTFGIHSILTAEKQQVLIASPEKAVCDKIVLTPGVNLRSSVQTRAFLLEDLRMEVELLRNFDTVMMESWTEDAPKIGSLKMLIQTLTEL